MKKKVKTMSKRTSLCLERSKASFVRESDIEFFLSKQTKDYQKVGIEKESLVHCILIYEQMVGIEKESLV